MVAAQTLAAAKAGATLAEKPELDLLLRLAGTRQIGEALKRAGYRSGKQRLFLVAAWEGAASEPKTLKRVASRDRRFRRLEERPPTEEDLDSVERAALLAASV